MKERPILFNSEMARAILDGRKTQTRRKVKNVFGYNRIPYSWISKRTGKRVKGFNHVLDPKTLTICPFGQVGDRLYVRETWKDVNDEGCPSILYKADGSLKCLADDEEYLLEDGSVNEGHPHIQSQEWLVWHTEVENGDEGHGWKPSIHMPRWASRILLEITNIRVESLQDISEEDARAEGFKSRADFLKAWDEIYGNVDNNPYVWVVEFQRVESE